MEDELVDLLPAVVKGATNVVLAELVLLRVELHCRLSLSLVFEESD
jgi:hypothetical protein